MNRGRERGLRRRDDRGADGVLERLGENEPLAKLGDPFGVEIARSRVAHVGEEVLHAKHEVLEVLHDPRFHQEADVASSRRLIGVLKDQKSIPTQQTEVTDREARANALTQETTDERVAGPEAANDGIVHSRTPLVDEQPIYSIIFRGSA